MSVIAQRPRHHIQGGHLAGALVDIALLVVINLGPGWRALPEAARRWLTHAIAPGTPRWPSVELTMHGEIRLGTWRPFHARQILATPDGFVSACRRPAGRGLRPLQRQLG